MGLLARADARALTRLAAAFGDLPEAEVLREPEIGTVMVRGRAGGTGEPFNLGEITVTRCSLRLAGGEVGHAWVQGRDRAKARTAALFDALLQTRRAGEVQARVLAPLEGAEREKAGKRAARAETTRVEFFTMVRGEE
jgi:alpha-D-ribose 1-methylphosphonate 5-triphosphate synthase subunit PhnG